MRIYPKEIVHYINLESSRMEFPAFNSFEPVDVVNAFLIFATELFVHISHVIITFYLVFRPQPADSFSCKNNHVTIPDCFMNNFVYYINVMNCHHLICIIIVRMGFFNLFKSNRELLSMKFGF